MSAMMKRKTMPVTSGIMTRSTRCRGCQDLVGLTIPDLSRARRDFSLGDKHALCQGSFPTRSDAPLLQQAVRHIEIGNALPFALCSGNDHTHVARINTQILKHVIVHVGQYIRDFRLFTVFGKPLRKQFDLMAPGMAQAIHRLAHP
jgi:hypothetical protein